MAKFPHPPPVADLVGLGVRADERRQLAVGTTLWRLYFQGGPHPTAWHDFRHFGPTAGRFDHHQPPPQPQARAILYAAELGPACVAEVYQDTRTIDRRRRSPWLVAFVLASPLTMLDLGSSWPTRVGASQAINSGPRPRAQTWSRAIVEAFPDLDGLCYPSSMVRNTPVFALYERAAAALPHRPTFNRPLADAALQLPLAEVAHEVGYALV
jgi:hypothetical protein